MRKEDADIVKRILSGDEEAYVLLYKSYVNDLYAYGTALTSNRDLLKDAIQDVFCRILERTQLLKEVSNIRAFLFRCLHNRIIDLQKHLVRNVLIEGKEVDFALHLEVSDERLAEDERQDLAWRVEQLLAKLPARQREAVCLRYFYDMDYEEISLILDLENPKSARNLVSKAICSLRKESTVSVLFLMMGFVKMV